MYITYSWHNVYWKIRSHHSCPGNSALAPYQCSHNLQSCSAVCLFYEWRWPLKSRINYDWDFQNEYNIIYLVSCLYWSSNLFYFILLLFYYYCIIFNTILLFFYIILLHWQVQMCVLLLLLLLYLCVILLHWSFQYMLMNSSRTGYWPVDFLVPLFLDERLIAWNCIST